jgi:hypothetical protein
MREIQIGNLEDLQTKALPRCWGGWVLSRWSLVYPAYDSVDDNVVNLNRAGRSSPEMLDCIMQVAGKPWATSECIAGLVRALDDIFYPQGTLCSFGEPGTHDAALIRSLIRSARARGRSKAHQESRRQDD